MVKKINITVIGGGSGTFNVLYGLKKIFTEEKRNLSVIVTMTDSGGTTGEIRDKYGVLPPGDIRRAIAALAKDTGFVRKLFEYKFKGEVGVIGGNKIGNVLLTVLADIAGNFENGLQKACEMFDTEGQIIPVTLEDVHLGAIFDDGTEVIGEKYIDISDKNDFERTHNIDQNIKEAFLVGEKLHANSKAINAIMGSDIIIIGPGDFYTSLVPNLLFEGVKEALARTKAKIIYVTNIMTKKGETTNYELPDFIDNLEKYVGEVLDCIIVNNGHISDELVEKYKEEEGKKPVKMKDTYDFMGKNYKIIEADLVNESDVVRHDPIKLAKVILSIQNSLVKNF